MPAAFDNATRQSLLMRLSDDAAAVREVAWEEFHAWYAPLIAGFARRLGVRGAEVDDVVQDVLLGFFKRVPGFRYDAGRGRFRGYLKVCTVRAVRLRQKQAGGAVATAPDVLDRNAATLETAWHEAWEENLLRRALLQIRARHAGSLVCQAFEAVVLQARSPAEVAEEFGMGIEGIYKAKQRISTELRQAVRRLRDEEPVAFTLGTRAT